MILILNGPINSGKSTVAKILQKKIPNTAHVEVDSLRRFIDWMDGEDAFPLSIENAVLVTKNLVKKGLNVIFAYILDEEDYKNVMDNLKDINVPIHTFTFSPDRSIATTNRGTRELTDSEKDRIQYHFEKNIHKPSFGEIVDNTKQSPEETAQVLYEKIKSDISSTDIKFKSRQV